MILRILRTAKTLIPFTVMAFTEIVTTSTELEGLAKKTCKKVKNLNINFDSDGDLYHLNKFPNLTSLCLRGNSMNPTCIEDFVGIESCHRLKHLTIVDIKLGSFNGLEFCEVLQEIYLSGKSCQIEQLVKLPGLKSLHLSSIKNVMELLKDNSWKDYPMLSSLTIESCGNLDSSCLAGLSVSTLKINCCGLKNIDSINVKKLINLDLSNNDITDITPLEKAVKLQKLNISYNNIKYLNPLMPLLKLARRTGKPLIRSFMCYGGKHLLIEHLNSEYQYSLHKSALEHYDVEWNPETDCSDSD